MKNLIVSFVVLITISCNKGNNCELPNCMERIKCEVPEQIIGTGEIIPNGLVLYKTSTLITWEMMRKDYVIRADSQNVVNLHVSFDNGTTFIPIDFNKYSVLGKYASGQCKVTFERNVTKDDSQKKYIYKIKVHECGKCKTNWEDMNWVLVPKIAEDYSVNFLIDQIER
ncbi:MAG: hypothetical protein SNJ71_08425 [Bacteroidales bacterium]